MWRRWNMNLNSYKAFDFVIPNCLEPGDIIEWEEEIYTVKKFDLLSDGFIIYAVDEMEDDVELLIPDNIVLSLMEEQ
jgi:hypothetical protein